MLSHGCKTTNRYFRSIPGPFSNGPSGNWTSNTPPPFTSRANHLALAQKDPLLAMSLLHWLGARGNQCRHRKYYISQAPLYQSPNYSNPLGCMTTLPLFQYSKIYLFMSISNSNGLKNLTKTLHLVVPSILAQENYSYFPELKQKYWVIFYHSWNHIIRTYIWFFSSSLWNPILLKMYFKCHMT